MMSHVHTHHNAETHDYAAANQQHFDKEAEGYDVLPFVQEHARQLTKMMVEKYSSLFDKGKTTLLDFACGTGAWSPPVLLGRNAQTSSGKVC